MMTDMIAAYYGLDHDSHDIFDGLKVAKIDAYAQYINRYAVVSFDAQSFRDNVENPLDFVPSIHERIGSEFRARWPEWTDSTMTLPRMMQALDDPDINYLDYIEIANAVRALGGEVEKERSFEGDPYYESMKRLG